MANMFEIANEVNRAKDFEALHEVLAKVSMEASFDLADGLLNTVLKWDRRVSRSDIFALNCEDYALDLEEFLWSRSNCPEENRKPGFVPVYAEDAFASLDITHEGNWHSFDKVKDVGFGYWALVPVDKIYAVDYLSCTGSQVHIVRAGDKFVVVHTKRVGNTTLVRLDRAGYRGFCHTRQVALQHAIEKFLREEYGFAELRMIRRNQWPEDNCEADVSEYEGEEEIELLDDEKYLSEETRRRLAEL